MTPMETVIGALERAGCSPRQNGSGIAARCPGHDDRVASLSITEGRDGKVLLYDHAGCDVARILEALGLTMRDLYPERQKAAAEQATVRYRICDRAGNLVATHVRRDGPDGKRIHWERGGKVGLGGLKTRDLPLYLAETVAGSTGVVIVTEGEKACDALVAQDRKSTRLNSSH